jgi:predicted type IV restriction endonuclease
MTKKISIDDEVEHVLVALSALAPDSEEYSATVKNLKELCEARSKKASRLVELDTIIAAGTNILGILLILSYEQLHVISTKAIGFIVKGRI